MSDRAIRAAARAAAQAVGRGLTPEEVSRLVERFGQHPDGYLHARVVVDGQRFYFHRRFGSWLAPGQVGSRLVLKEPEALLGNQLGSEIKYKLSELSKPYDERRRREREEAQRGQQRAAGAPEDSRVDGEAGSADRLRGGGDSVGADDEIPPD